jgi:hypothetical protein
MFKTVGSPTQRRQPAPSVTSERGTVLVNFVGFGNRLMLFRSGLKAGTVKPGKIGTVRIGILTYSE